MAEPTKVEAFARFAKANYPYTKVVPFHQSIGATRDDPGQASQLAVPNLPHAHRPFVMHPSHPLTVWLASGLLRDLAEEAEWRLPDEAGGVLIGYRNAGAIVVTGCIDAGPNAERWSDGLRPDREFQNAELDRIFIESDGAATFVGEWHSHPLARAIPSKRDRKTMRNTVTDPGSATTVALMLILERDAEEEAWSAVGWVGRLGRMGRLGRLEVDPVRLRVFRDQA